MTTSMKTSSTRRYGHYIDGRETEAVATQERRNPGTGELVATFAQGAVEDVEHALNSAWRSFHEGEWPCSSGDHRAGVLRRLAQLMRESHEELARMEAQEVGKPIALARGDVAGSISMVDYAAALALTHAGETYDNLGEELIGLVIREPAGVVGMITPWNFPVLQLMQKLPFALAAGCTAVIKPSTLTASTTLEVARMCTEAGVPPGVVNVVTGSGSVVGDAIARSPKVDLISFTGSTEVGATIQAAAATNSTRLSMELGGKAASIVMPDADLDQAAEGVLFGVLFNSGECCVSGARLLVHDSVADELLQRLVDKIGKVIIGAPLDEEAEVSAMIHQSHLDSVLEAIERATAEGATVLAGGSRASGGVLDEGFFVQPTIIDHVSPQHNLFSEEIFGPVLSVTRFGSTEEAIDLANSVDYGLANTVWSKSIQTALPLARRLRSGTVWVNTTIEGAPQLPTGGVKRSGYGREMGLAGFEEFTETKTLTLRLAPKEPFFRG